MSMTDETNDGPEPTTAELAQALDVTIEEAQEEMDAGNFEAADALLTAASETSDSLLDSMGVEDPANPVD
jgi:hypothetical protein